MTNLKAELSKIFELPHASDEQLLDHVIELKWMHDLTVDHWTNYAPQRQCEGRSCEHCHEWQQHPIDRRFGVCWCESNIEEAYPEAHCGGFLLKGE